MSKFDEKKLRVSSEKFRVDAITKFFGFTPRILKHYETTGVLSPDREDRNGYRTYTAEDAMMIQTAEQLKRTGLSMREIGQYFSGGLDIEKKRNELIELREQIEKVIDVLTLDMNVGVPQYSVQEEDTRLCYVKNYPLTADLLQKYLDTRDAYTCAIQAGCLCDTAHTFFMYCDGLLSYLRQPDRIDEDPHKILRFAQNGDQMQFAYYRVCVPILEAPKKISGATVERVTRKKSLTLKMAGEPLGGGELFLMLPGEAKKRGLNLTGNVWLMSETGPNKKTPQSTYTLIAAAEIE